MEKSHCVEVNDGLNRLEVAAPISKQKIPMTQLLRKESLAALAEWKDKANKVRY